MKNRTSLLIAALVYSTHAAILCAQPYQLPVDTLNEPVAQGPFLPNWESLAMHQVPEWFQDAKFGIWAHWGPQCVPEAGDWYGRKMYMEGNYMSDFHRQHYGHPSQFGFKDILPLFKAEHWTPEQLVRFYKEVVGAQYFFALGNHHDNFDLWDSKYQPWNAMNIGPHKDLLQGWAEAAKKTGLPFGISFHADHAWTWYETSRRFDLKGPMIGVKYDGWLTKEDGYLPNPDGTDKWWKGLDPQLLYVQQHDFSERSWDNTGLWNQWEWGNGADIPSPEFVNNFYNRTMDAINRYHPDLLYFDATALPFWPLSDAGLQITAHLYNTNPNAVVFGKILSEQQKSALVWDVERGAPNEIIPQPWQCCNCLGDWHYSRGLYECNGYKSAATVAKLLVDVVSKNGCMLLSVPLRGDGTPDEKEIAILEEFGAWMKSNKEAIYQTRPWAVFGEGPIAESDIPLNAQGFNDGLYQDASSKEIRYTQKNGVLYAAALGWPNDHQIRLKYLANNSQYFPEDIRKIELLGYGEVTFIRTDEALIINLPEPTNNIMPVIKITPKTAKVQGLSTKFNQLR